MFLVCLVCLVCKRDRDRLGEQESENEPEMHEARALLHGSSQWIFSDVGEHTEFGWAWGVEVESRGSVSRRRLSWLLLLQVMP